MIKPSKIDIRFMMTHLVWLLAMALCLSLTSCLMKSDADNMTICPVESQYEGKWQVAEQSSVSSMLTMTPTMMIFAPLPLHEVMKELMPESNIVDVQDAGGSGVLTYERLSTTEAGFVLSLYPQTWKLKMVLADGTSHDVSIYFAALDNDDSMSWSSITKEGVMTIILRATSFVVDDNAEQPVSLRLTFTTTIKRM